MQTRAQAFDPDCTRCPRLAGFLADCRETHDDYFGKPVPSFGPQAASLLIVGLAPGFHGANATGRPFTGDHAGVLLYETLHRHGLASAPMSDHADDGLKLLDCRITNAVRCVPPQNKPVGAEINNCRPYLLDELNAVPQGGAVFALGKIAHDSVIRACGLRLADFKFAHAGEHALPGERTLIDSYHCSRYNTNTRRLTPEMFDAVVARVKQLSSA